MILVTGGTGLVGSHLLYNLTNKGMDVKALIRQDSNKDAIYKVFSYYSSEPEKLINKISWEYGDLTDPISLEEALNGVEKVYHAAALVSFNKKIKKEIFRTNVTGTANLVNLCLEKNINKLCHVSSIGALGESEDNGLITEDMLWKPTKGVSAYSMSKFLSEMEVWRGITEGLNAVIVNPSVIIGPGNWDKGSSSFISLIDKGFRYCTDGTTGYVDVRDVAEIMVALMESNVAGERYTLVSENLSYQTFFKIIADKLGKVGPNIKIKKWKALLYSRFEWLYSNITRNEPKLTKETVQVAYKTLRYSNNKLQQIVPFNFRPINQSIEEIVKMYLSRSN